MIEIDGSHGEGGGSILRTALALSIFTGKDFKITNIRANRPKPGLAPQHLAAINAAADLSNAVVNGNGLGSTSIYFKPGDLKGGAHKIDIGTAGSLTLLLQSIILPYAFSNKKVSLTLVGGTDVAWSSPLDYFKLVFAPTIRPYCNVETKLFRRGYFPLGGGEVKVFISGKNNKKPLDFLLRKNLLQVRGVSNSSRDLEPAKVSERQSESAKLALKKLNTSVNLINEYSNSLSTGSSIVLSAVFGAASELDEEQQFIGTSAIGERGRSAEKIGLDAAEKLIAYVESGAPVDECLCDQLIPFLGIVGGRIKANRLTKHTFSNIHVTEQFLDVNFIIKENEIFLNAPEILKNKK